MVMMRQFKALLSILGLTAFSCIGLAACESEKDEIYRVPSFSVPSLQSGGRNEELLTALSTTGLLSVQLDGDEFAKARQAALQGLCRCTNSPEFLRVDGTASFPVLSDTSTTRTTLATATVGNTPLSLPQEELEKVCGAETAESMETLRDVVSHVSTAFVAAVDRLLYPNETPLLHSKHGVEYSSLSSIVESSKHLEHFHVYEKQYSEEEKQRDVLPLHTDAGLFLTFVPGLSCDAQDSAHFYIESPHSKQRVAFSDNSIGIMLGAGAQHWLDASHNVLKLKATRHAVLMQPGERRAWYGMMHLVPQHALVDVKEQLTFEDLQRAMGNVENKEDVSIGCGTIAQSNDSEESQESPASTIQRRRRLQHITNGSSCNNVTNHFCWMTCQDIPDADKAQEYIDQGKSLYCLEPAVFGSTGGQVSAAVDACTEIGVVGLAMNEACVGSWQTTAEGVTAQQVRVDISQEDLEEPWCYGGTSMYMDGFQWIDTTCVIYLFPAWVLSAPGTLAAACIGTLAFGIALEGVIFARRRTVQSMTSGWRQLGVSTLMYGVQLTMGYMLMLVVMTYSGPLFLCVVVGLMAGHFVFNSKLFKDKKVAEQSNKKTDGDCCGGTGGMESASSSDDCCGGTGRMDSASSSDDNCCGQKVSTDSRDISPCVPEGSTPCCQNTLSSNEVEEFDDEETWIWPIRKRTRYRAINKYT